MKIQLIPSTPLRMVSRSNIIGLCLMVALLARATPPAAAPASQTAPAPPAVQAAPVIPVAPLPQLQPGGTAPALLPRSQPATYLAWNTEAVTYNAKPGELAAQFTFYVTNVSHEVVIVHSLARSCGCTEAKLPEQPWSMVPGTNGAIVATIDLRGKSGRISKTLTVNSSAGSKTLLLHADIPVVTGGIDPFNRRDGAASSL